MVFKDKRVIEWHEEESPFEALKKSTGYEKVILDEHARYFIATGLQKVSIDVIPATDAIQSIRAVKSDAELAILRGINEFTIELVRSLAKFAKVGLTQGEILEAATSLFDKAGLKGGAWALVLLGDQASNPHGGSFGKILKDHEFVLIDIGSSLHGYGSDVTRTFLPAGSTVSDELWDSWYTVYAAQSAAIALMKVNETCSLVDAASRKVCILLFQKFPANFGTSSFHQCGAA
jgi:Xaa-Pro aminopeptidase